MRAALHELRDPAGLLLAAGTAVAARVVQENVLIAIAAALAVLVVKSVAAGLLPDQSATAIRPIVSGLTRKEIEVAGYVRLGLSNKEIGTRLGNRSERTADSHVQNIMSKLGFHSRAQIAAWAAEQGLPEKSTNSAPR